MVEKSRGPYSCYDVSKGQHIEGKAHSDVAELSRDLAPTNAVSAGHERAKESVVKKREIACDVSVGEKREHCSARDLKERGV